MSVNDWLGIWGGFLSTVLAVIKIREAWKSRDRLDVSLVTTSSEEHGNFLQIRNISDKPMLIEHWEIFAAHDRTGGSEHISIESRGFDENDTPIPPHSSVRWTFSEANYFRTDDKFLKGRSIYLKLWIVGRKPWSKKLYPFDN